MQAMKFSLKSAAASVLISAAAILTLASCGEKTPEQIAAENRKITAMAIANAKEMYQAGKRDDAVALLEKTQAQCGQNADLSETLAQYYDESGKTAEAALMFESASDLREDGDAAMLLKAAKAYKKLSSPQAEASALQKYLKLKPSDFAEWANYADVLESMDRNEEALNARLDILKNSKKNPDTEEATRIGLLFVKLGQAPMGRKWLEAAFKSTIPESKAVRGQILAGLIKVYLSQKETASVQWAVAQMDKIDPKFVDKNYPTLHAQLAEFRKSIKEAKAAAGIKEDAVVADQGEPDPYDEVAKMPNDVEKHVLDSNYYLSKGDIKGAEKSAHMAIFKDRKSPIGWRALANAYEAAKKYDDSFMAAREAYERDKSDPDNAVLYLRNAIRVKEPQDFFDDCYALYKKFPDVYEVRIDLAKAYKAIGDKNNAKYFYETFLKNAPKEHPLYKEIDAEYREMVEGIPAAAK